MSCKSVESGYIYEGVPFIYIPGGNKGFRQGWMVRGGEVRSIVPGGSQTSSIRVPPIIWRVSASRIPVQSTSILYCTHRRNRREQLPLHGCATWRYLSRCVESYLHGGRLCSYSFSGNRSSNLPRNCKVTLGVKFICVRLVCRCELRAILRLEKKNTRFFVFIDRRYSFLCFNGEKYRCSRDNERER